MNKSSCSTKSKTDGCCCPIVDLTENVKLSLDEIIEMYNKNNKDRLEKELDSLQSLEDFVYGLPQDPADKGKKPRKHNHQRRMTPETARKALERLRQTDLKKPFGSFEDLLRKFDHTTINGVGPVTSYDIALRYGRKNGVAPCDYVYLHAGTMEGARALQSKGYIKNTPKLLSITEFPLSLQKIGSAHIENLLCIYKNILKNNLVPILKRGTETRKVLVN